MYDVIIGHYEEDKNIPFWGQKLSYRVETLHTGWRPLALQHIFRFFENFENFGFCDHFSKKSYFLKILWLKKQNFKNPRQPFCRPSFSMYHPFLFAFDLKTLFLVNFETFTFYRPKIAEVTSQNSTYSKKFPVDFNFHYTRRRQIGSRRGVPSFMSIQ